MGVISRESENYRTNQTPVVPLPTSANTNRVQGRRGGRQGSAGGRGGQPVGSRAAVVNGFPQPPSQPPPESTNVSDISYR